MNYLEKYFYSNTKNIIHKWNHFFEIYDRHFSRFRGKEVVILEIGVSHGGSLQMWKDYFGKKAKIIGVDIDPECKKLEEDNIKIYIGSQEDRDFLRFLKKEIPEVDLLIDDGGHTMTQQIATFEELYEHIKEDGVYLCEDLHTSYWEEYGGGYKKKGTFIEYSKNFIDYINAWHSHSREVFDVNDFTKTANSLHYYDSILVIEKKKRNEPSHQKTGHPTLNNNK
jgi:23S rRNA U2552 (ribose-2'-O)-methylase RlmE/FtsJ